MNSTPANAPAAHSAAESRLKSTLLIILLQASHRLGAIALLATLGTWAMMYIIRDFHVPLAIAAGTADAGLCCGIAARMLTRSGQPARREANGVAVFNLIFFILAIYLMLFARLEIIRAAASDFFTPSALSPETSPHG